MKNFLGQLKNEKFILYTENLISEDFSLDNKYFKVLDENTIEVSVSTESNINSLIQELSSQGIKVKSLKNKTSRLEELFMRLVDKNDK